MSLDRNLSGYEEVKENYNQRIIGQNYRFLGVCEGLDKGVYCKICYNKNKDIEVKYLLEVGPGSYENPTVNDLDSIKKEFGDAKNYIQSKSEKEISHIVESFNSIPKPILI